MIRSTSKLFWHDFGVKEHFWWNIGQSAEHWPIFLACQKKNSEISAILQKFWTIFFQKCPGIPNHLLLSKKHFFVIKWTPKNFGKNFWSCSNFFEFLISSTYDGTYDNSDLKWCLFFTNGLSSILKNKREIRSIW